MRSYTVETVVNNVVVDVMTVELTIEQVRRLESDKNFIVK